MTDPRFEFLSKKLDSLRQLDSLRTLVPRDHDGAVLIERVGRRLINFGSNDYLGLGCRQSKTPDTFLTGAGASALVSGFTGLHEQLCRELAELEQTEAAVVFPSGYAACSGAVATLAEEGDLLLSDSLNHASLIDGCRLSSATRFVYPHRDVDAVRELLVTHRHKHARAWIVTDGVFGMDGDVAPLEALCDLADSFDANLIVDEAHATGVLGNDGSGCCAELNVKSRVAIRIGTLSKAIGSHGGFVVGPQLVIDYLVNRCRSLIFSTAGSPLTIAAAIEALRILRDEPDRRQRVRMLASQFRRQLHDRFPGKLPVTTVDGVPIVPLIIGGNGETMRMESRLNEAGFFVPAIRPPTVPHGTARLRISLTAGHQVSDIDELTNVLFACLPEK